MKKFFLSVALLFSTSLAWTTPSQKFNSCTGCADWTMVLDTNTIVAGAGITTSCTGGVCTVSGGGGGGGSGYNLQPSTVTPRFDLGLTASTGTFTSSVTVRDVLLVSSNAIFAGSTFYANGNTVIGKDLEVHPYDFVNNMNILLGQWTIRQIVGDGNLYLGRFAFGESAAITIQPNTGSGGELDVTTLGISKLSLPLSTFANRSLTIGQQSMYSDSSAGDFHIYNEITGKEIILLERDTGDMRYKTGTIFGSYGVSASTLALPAMNVSVTSATVTGAGGLTTTYGDTVGSMTIIGSLAFSTGTAVKTSNYTMTGSDHVIFASSTLTTISTMTLPFANALAPRSQEAIIWKSDGSTTPVSIIAPVGDTIVGLSTISLASQGSNQTLYSDGVHTWWPQGTIAHPPAFMGNNQDIGSAAATVASTTYHQAWDLSQPCDTKSITYNIGATGGASMTWGVYDRYGNLKVSSGPFVIAGTGNQNTLVPRFTLQPGLYYLAVGFSNASATITRYMSNLVAAGMSGGAYSKAQGLDATTGAMLPSIGFPPVFENNSTRSPAIITSCYNGAP